MWTQCVPTPHPRHPLNMHAEGGRSQSRETENTGNRAGGGETPLVAGKEIGMQTLMQRLIFKRRGSFSSNRNRRKCTGTETFCSKTQSMETIPIKFYLYPFGQWFTYFSGYTLELSEQLLQIVMPRLHSMSCAPFSFYKNKKFRFLQAEAVPGKL